MTSALGSVTVSGLLGGTAGKIDTDALIASLMQAEAIPQNQLKDQLTQQQNLISAFQAINTRMAALQTAAESVTDPTSWNATTATTSNSAVIASSTAAATQGATTFHVQQLASAQVSTVAADTDGNVIANFADGITVKGTHIDLTSGKATDVAAAINQAGLGVRAATIQTDSGVVLQLTAASSGTANAFTATGFGDGTASATQIVAAKNAQITVGDPNAGGYTISSATNTFTTAMPGVTFSVGAGAIGQDVTISVASDTPAIANMVQSLVGAANSAKSGIASLSGQGGILQSQSDIRSISLDLGSAISLGTADGKSLTDFGIDMDKNGVISFDSAAFTAAYTADPTGTMQAISGSLGTRFAQTADAATAPATGTITQAISSANSLSDDLNKQISDWGDRLDDIKTRMTLKYAQMQTTLAKLQSQGDWLTSMFKSLDNNQSDSNQ